MFPTGKSCENCGAVARRRFCAMCEQDYLMSQYNIATHTMTVVFRAMHKSELERLLRSTSPSRN